MNTPVDHLIVRTDYSTTDVILAMHECEIFKVHANEFHIVGNDLVLLD